MNKTAIKNFAIWARNKLIAGIESKAMMVGITEAGIADKVSISTNDTEFYDAGTKDLFAISGKEIKQRSELVKVLAARAKDSDYKTAYHAVLEEVAYTWFNRLIALRFMEVNGYLYDDMRILSSVNAGKVEPDAVTNPFDWDFEFTDEERDIVCDLQNSNKIDELFRLLFIKECNALNDSLPALFEKTADYTEFLLNISVTDIDGVVYKLVHDIPEEDFNIELGGQVEIIGWLYQYYNTEPKDKVFADLKKNIKVTKEKIPAATQLFTPDWIVRYMVENSLGRLWLEGHPDADLQAGWKYYLEEAEQEPDVVAQLEELRKDRKNINPEDIKIIDPCMGSGHILVYAFDVLMDIYRAQGYVDRDAAQSIITNNLYGLDIDQRAFQLAYFAVMMKGRQYDRRMLTRGLEPNLCAIEESNGIERYQDLAGDAMSEAKQLQLDDQYFVMADYLISKFHDAKEYGSILNVDNQQYDVMLEYIESQKEVAVNSLFLSTWFHELGEKLPKLVKQAKIMSQLYDVVVTNPPYLGKGKTEKLNQKIQLEYPESTCDLYAAFISRCIDYAKHNSYISMITMQSWMFISSYFNLRNKLYDNLFVNMNHVGTRAFDEINGEVVATTSFVLTNHGVAHYKGKYIRNIFGKNAEEKQRDFHNKNLLYTIKQEEMTNIPGKTFAYWLSDKCFSILKNTTLLSDIQSPRTGMTTGDNDRFLRLWYEVYTRKVCYSSELSLDKASEAYKWFPYSKGGGRKKWYGLSENIVNWSNSGYEIKNNIKENGKKAASVRNEQHYYKEMISYSSVSTSGFSARAVFGGHLFDSGGSSIVLPRDSVFYNIIGILNSHVGQFFLKMFNDTQNFQPGDVGRMPIFIDDTNDIDETVKCLIEFAEYDWNSFEISWDFSYNPLYAAYHLGKPSILRKDDDNSILISHVDDLEDKTLAQCYEEYKSCTNDMFSLLKSNEEELNRIFIDIYGLQDELTPEVADKDVTIASIFDSKDDIPESYKGNNYVLTKEDVIKNLLSYAVGCLFGRYSLKKPGLIYAGGDWDTVAAEMWTEEDFARGIPDDDNVIPITDETYFEDDIVGRFIRWLEDAFGTEHLEDNLTFIADALSVKGANSRDIIRNYFLTGFYKDHVQKYQKRPIYWLYDSGKANGFKALVYMHRYDADTTGRVRMDYLHKMQQTYGDEINRANTDISESTDNREKAKLQKRLIKLQKQAKECQEYDESIAHLALERIDIDLDDGVKVNYEKVQTDRNGKKYQILGKI